jgi:hypothetical protein
MSLHPFATANECIARKFIALRAKIFPIRQKKVIQERGRSVPLRPGIPIPGLGVVVCKLGYEVADSVAANNSY